MHARKCRIEHSSTDSESSRRAGARGTRRNVVRGVGGGVVCKIIERQALRSVLFWWTPWVRGRLPASARVGWSTALVVALYLPLHLRSAPPPRPLAASPPPGVCSVWWRSRCARAGGLSSAVLASSPPVGARCGSSRSPPCSPRGLGFGAAAPPAAPAAPPAPAALAPAAARAHGGAAGPAHGPSSAPQAPGQPPAFSSGRSQPPQPPPVPSQPPPVPSSQSYYLSQLPTACPTCGAPLERKNSRKGGENFTRPFRACFKKDAARVNKQGEQVTHYMEWENTAEEWAAERARLGRV